MTDWGSFTAGMAAAREVPDVASQAMTGEAMDAGGPDFMSAEKDEAGRDWQRGYDYAIWLARQSCRK